MLMAGLMMTTSLVSPSVTGENTGSPFASTGWPLALALLIQSVPGAPTEPAAESLEQV